MATTRSPSAGRCWARALTGRDLDKALADCDRALRLAPKTPEFLDSRGLVHLRRVVQPLAEDQRADRCLVQLGDVHRALGGHLLDACRAPGVATPRLAAPLRGTSTRGQPCDGVVEHAQQDRVVGRATRPDHQVTHGAAAYRPKAR